MKCWAVTQGEYSDYRILAVFSTKAAADAWANNENAIDAGYKREVEEFDLDPPLRIKVEMWRAHGRVTVDGEREDITPVSVWVKRLVYPGDRSTAGNAKVWRHQHYVDRDGVVYPENVSVDVSGWDKERVARIYSDTMARLVAEAGRGLVRGSLTSHPPHR